MAAHEECARCGIVGPMDVACVGCALITGRDAMAVAFDNAVADAAPRARRRGGLSRCRRLASVLAARLVLA